MPRKFEDYRLGNILDAWYGQEHVKRVGGCSWDVLTYDREGTFADFLRLHQPTWFVPDISLCPKFADSAAKWWWCYFYESYREVGYHFVQSMRTVMNEYFGPIEVQDQCVIHFRVGDFLRKDIQHFCMSVDDIVSAVQSLKLPSNASIVILPSGVSFRTDQATYDQSVATLKDLKRKIIETHPHHLISFAKGGTPDDDFVTAVRAKWLVTGLGSYALMAAAANGCTRLTPAVENANHVSNADLQCSLTAVLPGWTTYPLTSVAETK